MTQVANNLRISVALACRESINAIMQISQHNTDMSLQNDNLSVWEIGFRWAGYDSTGVRLRIPLHVRDNFRTLMDAVLCGHLASSSLSIEKYGGNDQEEAKFYIRYWLNDINSCVEGVAFSKKLLRWARVERWDFKDWCGRRRIPLPEFWFPPGWALEYEWNEAALVLPEASSVHSEPAGLIALHTDVCGESRLLRPSGELSAGAEDTLSAEPSRALRENQRRTIAVQVVAANLWRKFPDMTIAAMVQHEVIQSLCGGEFQVAEVVRKWVRSVAPAEVKKRRGRPRLEKGTPDT